MHPAGCFARTSDLPSSNFEPHGGRPRLWILTSRSRFSPWRWLREKADSPLATRPLLVYGIRGIDGPCRDINVKSFRRVLGSRRHKGR